MKREKLKREATKLALLQTQDPERAKEKLERMDSARVDERMSLKHRKSKWAAKLQQRAKTDRSVSADKPHTNYTSDLFVFCYLKICSRCIEYWEES